MPTVSVIVPNYNHAVYLRQRIDSVLSQTFQDFELILLDDNSTDESCEIMDDYRNHPKVSHVVRNNQNSGSAFHQWKKGIDLAVGKWLWIAESDDWADNTFLEKMMQVVGKDSRCVMGSSIPRYVFSDGKTWNKECDGEIQLYQGPDFVRRRLVLGNSLPNVSALLLHREAVGKIDFSSIAKMRLCGDWLLYAKLCEQGTVVEYQDVLSYFRQHGDNTSTEAEKNGLPLIEGVEVLDYVTRTFQVAPKFYAKGWGHVWAKLEQQHHYTQAIRKEISHRMKHYPAISFWHRLYQIKSAL